MRAPIEERDWLTVTEAASALRVSEDTIRRAIAKGTLPHVRPSGNPRGAIRIPRTALPQVGVHGPGRPQSVD